jgi:DNA-binding protein H-NS
MSKTFLKGIAKSKIAAKRAAEMLSEDELKSLIANLRAAKQSKARREAEKATKLKAANIKKVKSLMDQLGISATDVKSSSDRRKPKKAPSNKRRLTKKKTGPKKGSKVAPKYQLKTGNQVHKWTGRGRMPLVFKDYVTDGGSLEKCLIK